MGSYTHFEGTTCCLFKRATQNVKITILTLKSPILPLFFPPPTIFYCFLPFVHHRPYRHCRNDSRPHWLPFSISTTTGPDWRLTTIVAARARRLSDRIPAGHHCRYRCQLLRHVHLHNGYLFPSTSSLESHRLQGPTRGRHGQQRASFRANYSHLRPPFGSLLLLSCSPPTGDAVMEISRMHRRRLGSIGRAGRT